MPEKSDPTAERRDEIVKRMLATPPMKHTPKKVRAAVSSAIFVVLDGELRVASARPDKGRSIDVFRNLDDLRDGKPMERQVRVRG